jgi:hypothetical protein
MSKMRPSPSSLNLKAIEKDAPAPPTITFTLSARHFPLLTIGWGICTLAACISLNRWHGHDIGGIPWPYISDTAKDAPQSALFGFGMTMACAMMAVVIVINYGKCKRELYLLADAENGGGSAAGLKRNKLALVCGLLACPNLGLLACFDTKRTPGLHLAFVLGFFPFALVFLFAMTSLYRLLTALAAAKSGGDSGEKGDKTRFISLQRSLWWKSRVTNVFCVFFALYLPVGMQLVSDWHDYRNDVLVHTCRAVCQHVCVVCLILYFGTFYFDFGDSNLVLLQV